MKKEGIRTPGVQFEMRKNRIILYNIEILSIFSVSFLAFTVLIFIKSKKINNKSHGF